MKKTLSFCFYTTICLFVLWFAVSYVDIVADNCEPNPTHHKYNLFVLLVDSVEDKDNEEIELDENELAENELVNTEVERLGMCGSPIQEWTRITTGFVDKVEGDHLTITTEDGHQWGVDVGYGENFSEGDYLCVYFDTMDTDQIDDDEIVKLWFEVW